ncbi:hypothetical protein N7490_006266 [Penicillium lividum]|nr:hypothetical protein N7490_006266 [Penicillium lividum]
MPKFPTPSRNPAVAAPTRTVRKVAGSGPSSAHTLRPLPAGVDHTPQYASQGMQVRSMAPITRNSRRSSQEDLDEDEDFERVHARCTRTIKSAEERHRQLTARLAEQRQEASMAAQQFGAEKAQLNAMVRQISSEKQKAFDESRRLKVENTNLQQRLDAADLDVQNQVTRDELNEILREIHTASLSVTNKVATKISESQNVQGNASLPYLGVTQGSWVGQDGHFDLSSNPLLPENAGPLFGSSDPQDLAEFDTYVNPMP